MKGRSIEPFFWSLFSSGGMLCAMVLPALAAILWIAVPLGWIAAPNHESLVALVAHPIIRLALFGLVALGAFHWGHRFRFTLYDGLQLKHLFGLIAAVCYGTATALTVLAAYVLWTL